MKSCPSILMYYIVFSGDTSSTFAPRVSRRKTPCVPAVHLCTPYKKCKAASYYDAVTERTTQFYRGWQKKKSVINKIRENNILLLYSESNRFWISYRNIRMCLTSESVFFRRYFYCVYSVTRIIIIVRQRCRVARPTDKTLLSLWPLLRGVYTKRPTLYNVFTTVVEKKKVSLRPLADVK